MKTLKIAAPEFGCPQLLGTCSSRKEVSRTIEGVLSLLSKAVTFVAHLTMKRITLSLAVIGVCLVLTGPARAAHRRVVISIAQNVGLAREWPLKYAHRDAERFVSVMTELGGVHESDVYLLLGATAAQVRGKIRSIAGDLEENATLVIFFSGHGSGEALHLDGETLPIARLTEFVQASQARLKLMFIDACRGAERRKGFTRAPPFRIAAPTATHEGQVVVNAAGPGEFAYESESFEGGVFTHYLVSGLRGGADFDRDGVVSLQEAYQFAYQRTRQDMRERGHPGPGGPDITTILNGQGPVVMTSVHRASTLLRLPAELAETYYVIVSKGTGFEVAQAWSDPERKTPIALSKGQYIVHRKTPRGASRAEVAIPLGGVRNLSASDFVQDELRASVDLEHKGGDHILAGASPHPHRLGVAIGLLTDSSESWAGVPTVSLFYAHGTSGWLPYVTASIWRRSYSTGTELTRDGLSFAVGAIHQWVRNTFTARAGASVSATGLRQHVFDRNPSVSGGRELGLGGGARLDVSVSFPLTGRLSTDLGLTGLATAYDYKIDGEGTLGGYSIENALMVNAGLTVGL